MYVCCMYVYYSNFITEDSRLKKKMAFNLQDLQFFTHDEYYTVHYDTRVLSNQSMSVLSHTTWKIIERIKPAFLSKRNYYRTAVI